MKDYFNSFSILLQKQKNAGYFNDESTKDYIIVNFDPKGNFRNYKLFETAKQKFFNTYLFSEENKEKDEALFFYAERIKENNKKEWFLIINKIKDGVITQDKIPFKTDNSNLSFAKAKYGYIYVIESDKENKELSIRLEKLNL